MPNIVTHALITNEAFPEVSADLVLGSTLPDFIGMNRDYLGGKLTVDDARQEPELAAGITIHLRTDTLFDNLPLRLQLLSDGEQDCTLHIPDLNPDTARRLANVGTDVLLDTIVLESEKGEEVYKELKRAILTGKTAVNSLGDNGLETLIRRYFEQDRARKYSDTVWLAEMLRHRSSLRQRHILNFEDNQLPRVAEMFDRQLERIRKAAGGLVALTIDGLKDVN